MVRRAGTDPREMTKMILAIVVNAVSGKRKTESMTAEPPQRGCGMPFDRVPIPLSTRLLS
jgi:hypothetical protein